MVVLTSTTNYTFSNGIIPTVDSTGTVVAETVGGTGTSNTLTFTVTFPITAASTLTTITSIGVTGFVAPATGGTPITVSSLTPGSPTQYTVTSLTWSPAITTSYTGSTVYTAMVVLTSESGCTFSTALTPTVNNGTAAAGTVVGTGTGNTLAFMVTFPTTAAAATTIPLPVFSASPTSGSAPLSVTFIDASTGSPASWSWSFGDGNSSTLENPTNTYVNNGTYSVTLTETNSVGTNATTMTGYIVVGAAAPVAGFTADPTSGTAPLMIQFTDSSTNTPTSWTWSFGDGVSSSVQDPVHTYTAAGTYTITLIATNTEGSNVATQTNLITVTSAQTVTQITTQATPVPTPLAPTFAITAAETTDSSTADWLAKQNAVVATTTKKSPGYDMFSALIGCGVIAGIAVYRKR